MAEKDISKAPEITTISDMFRVMEKEIAAVKSQEMSEGQGRVVLGFRRTQMKGADLNLQFMRLMRGKGGQGNNDKELRMVHGERVEEKPQQIADKPQTDSPKPNSTQQHSAATD